MFHPFRVQHIRWRHRHFVNEPALYIDTRVFLIPKPEIVVSFITSPRLFVSDYFYKGYLFPAFLIVYRWI